MLIANLSLASAEVGKDICKKVTKIQVELLALVEETNDQDISRASKFLKNF